MIEIKITHDLDELRAKLGKLEKERWPKVLAQASNETGFYVRNKVYSEMDRFIDRPRAFTKNSLFVKRGNDKDIEATVMWRPGSLSGSSAGRYLKPLVDSGPRGAKGFEKLLQYKGILPAGYYAVPTKDAPEDNYGNVPGSYIVRIISFLRAFRDARQNRNLNQEKAKKKKLQFFAVPPGPNKAGLSPGIYERISLFGGAIRKVFNFTTKATYKQQFPFYDIAKEASVRKFPSKLDEAIKKALDNQRGI